MRSILFVDDETQILKSLRRLFLDSDYQIFTAESGEDGLAVLEKEPIDLVISDMRMPYMDGYQFLSKVKEQYPKTLRIVLSGFADEKVIFKALQKNIAKLYMFKPWENDKLSAMIEHIFATEDVLNSKDLLEKINNIDGLPTIRGNYLKILELLESDTDIIDIAREIEKDPSIASKLLQIANSAYYGFKTGSIQYAVAYLGLQNVRNIILSASIIDGFSTAGPAGEKINRLWRHAFASNKLLIFIYERFFSHKLPDLASSAGLLHDIGVVFMMKYFPERYVDIINKWEDGVELEELEREKIGVSHSETGGHLLQWWELPYPIVEAALYHHNPCHEAVLNKELVAAVHLADYYSWKIVEKKSMGNVDPRSYALLKTDKSTMEAILAEFDPNI